MMRPALVATGARQLNLQQEPTATLCPMLMALSPVQQHDDCYAMHCIAVQGCGVSKSAALAPGSHPLGSWLCVLTHGPTGTMSQRDNGRTW
jgi:hypothetical protein